MTFEEFETQGLYPHPFSEVEVQDYEEPSCNKDAPRTLIELTMCELSATIREKSGWEAKFKDQQIQRKWRQEIVEQQKDAPAHLRLTENMINYVMTELEAFAGLRDEKTGIEAGPYDRIWRSDTLIPPDLRAALLAAVAPLENVPDAEKDWHPGSDGLVLDLVHPSLYPVIYGRTADHNGIVVPVPDETDEFDSKRFQWMPSDFKIDDNLSASLVSPYINNMHTFDHSALYGVLSHILSKAVPLFERVLSDLSRDELPTRMEDISCIWPDGYEPSPEDYDIDPEALDAWLEQQPKNYPDSKPSYEDGLVPIQHTDCLKGTEIQIIVKLANIVLTPDKPEYRGGSWHVEGMRNEHIVASFIYYYDCENITESTLSFRNATGEPQYHEQFDSFCMRRLYGIDGDDRCVQAIGKIGTKEHRAIAFPNIYQHCVSPFKLVDPTKPGHRKILVFFLVDPHCTIPSAKTVAPQQQEWIIRAIKDAPEGALWNRLPVEIVCIIISYSAAMTREDAEEYRLELMKERTAMVETVDNNRFGATFNMCEH